MSIRLLEIGKSYIMSGEVYYISGVLTIDEHWVTYKVVDAVGQELYYISDNSMEYKEYIKPKVSLIKKYRR